MYDESDYRLEYERRRAARLERSRARRRAQRRRTGAFLLSLVLIAAMAVVLLLQGKNNAATEAEDPAPVENNDDRSSADPLYPELYSKLDADGDGVDDYHDIMQGARDYIATKPVYNENGYYEGGYPDDGTGVCADVIGAAFLAAGYDLKALLDADVQAHPEWYTNIRWPEPNIDFRRVINLDHFFSHNAQSLTCSLAEPEEWQPGDIVIFGDQEHIAICSDRRRSDGIPWIIHHGTLEEGPVEVDAMNRHEVTGHYRWNGGS